MNNVLSNNNLSVVGEICSDFEYSHEMYGEKFYKAYIKSKRQSGTYDIIPFMISDRMIQIEDLRGVEVLLKGQFRSFNKYENDKCRVMLYVFVLELQELEAVYDCNEIMLQGYICKEPIYRKTPLGREITDFVIAVNRQYGRSDYIPCICWGRDARYLSTMKAGDAVKVIGRLQSREYAKSISETEFEIRTAYEVSARIVKGVEE